MPLQKLADENNIQTAIANRSQEDNTRIKAKQSLAQLGRDTASKDAAQIGKQQHRLRTDHPKRRHYRKLAGKKNG